MNNVTIDIYVRCVLLVYGSEHVHQIIKRQHIKTGESDHSLIIYGHKKYDTMKICSHSTVSIMECNAEEYIYGLHLVGDDKFYEFVRTGRTMYFMCRCILKQENASVRELHGTIMKYINKGGVTCVLLSDYNAEVLLMKAELLKRRTEKANVGDRSASKKR
jgi:hypothetical protein